jgi:DNA modification methylase
LILTLIAENGAQKVTETNKNYLFQGNCIDFLKTLPDASVDHCITDPPYNISGYDGKKKIGWLASNSTWTEDKNFVKIDAGWDKFRDSDYREFTSEWLTEIRRVVKPNGNILVFGSYHNIYQVGVAIETLGLKVNNSIIWYKRNAFPNITGRMLCESTEQIIWAVNGTRKRATNWTFNYDELKKLTENGKQMRNMWDIPMTPTSEKKHGRHPSQKPLVLSERLIIGFTNPGDIVLDPFLGSGSFLVAAKKLGRNYIGVDQEEEFINLSHLRLADV